MNNVEPRRTVTLNDKGILLLGIVILSLTFSLGFMTSSKRETEQKVTVFTRSDLERIIELQEMEDKRESGANIYAYKDENDNLMIGWDYNDSKR